MKNNVTQSHFLVLSDAFFERLNMQLLQRFDVQLQRVLAPQSVACYQACGMTQALQLRLVMIPFSNGTLMGRLSWLDERGVDHVCCYVDETFTPLNRALDGHWRKNQNRVEALCLQSLEILAA